MEGMFRPWQKVEGGSGSWYSGFIRVIESQGEIAVSVYVEVEGAREQVLSDEIDKIIAEIEGGQDYSMPKLRNRLFRK